MGTSHIWKYTPLAVKSRKWLLIELLEGYKTPAVTICEWLRPLVKSTELLLIETIGYKTTVVDLNSHFRLDVYILHHILKGIYMYVA
jgi:hypothetical protein